MLAVLVGIGVVVLFCFPQRNAAGGGATLGLLIGAVGGAISGSWSWVGWGFVVGTFAGLGLELSALLCLERRKRSSDEVEGQSTMVEKGQESPFPENRMPAFRKGT